ncbi:MAG: hypothetical protein J5755_02320, partial [Clostridia bacterium]|nr:hypothetical protein [Clostridia bacterium]
MKKFVAIVCCLIVTAALVLTFVGCDDKEEFAPKARSSAWMNDLSSGTLLSDISMPGSHDSGALRSGGIYEFSNCQDLTIPKQLASGVRFLDIRLGFKKGKLAVYHGPLYQKLFFED